MILYDNKLILYDNKLNFFVTREYFQKKMEDIKLPQLPIEIIKIILIFRVHQSFYDKCKNLEINALEFCEFLKKKNAVVFGSFIVACLLDNDNFGDIDILISKPITEDYLNPFGNNLKKGFDPKLFTKPFIGIGPMGCVLKMCECMSTTRCLIIPKCFIPKSRKFYIEKSEAVKFDFVEVENVKNHLDEIWSDMDNIHFNGIDFISKISIERFIFNPRFKLKSIQSGTNFEKIYSCECPEPDYKTKPQNSGILRAVQFSKDLQLGNLQDELISVRKTFKEEYSLSWFGLKELNLNIQ